MLGMKIKGQKIDLKYKKKKFSLEVCKVPWYLEGIGMMFCRREKAKALLFRFKKPMRMKIHSLFVFFPFVAIWLDEKNKILDLKIVKPWNLSVSSRKSFSKLVEIPINERYREIIRFLVESKKDL